MTDERSKTATDAFNEEVSARVETYMRALLMLERASRGGATGPGAKNDIALGAAGIMLKVAEMFERLAVAGRGDDYAREMDWSSAEELSRFLWEETAPAN